ncbi:hypothetical protein AUP68_08390 [Ilyonectria robusta]
MGRHSLDICMLVADELRKTYFGAELVYRLFSLAKTQINNGKRRQLSTNDSQAASNTNLQNSMPHLLHGTRERIDAITNQDSTFAGFEGPITPSVPVILPSSHIPQPTTQPTNQRTTQLGMSARPFRLTVQTAELYPNAPSFPTMSRVMGELTYISYPYELPASMLNLRLGY